MKYLLTMLVFAFILGGGGGKKSCDALYAEANQRLAQIEHCQDQYSCWSCYYQTKDIEWCMTYAYRPELED